MNGRHEPGRRTRSPLDAVEDHLRDWIDRRLDGLTVLGEDAIRRVRGWVDVLLDEIAEGGAGMQAAVGGLRAATAGRNPVLGALAGLVSALSVAARIGLAVLVAVALLLGPLLLVVLLVALLVAVVIGALRAAGA